MKRSILILFAVLSINLTSAQISLDTILNSSNSLGWSFFPVQLDANETKYLFRDTINNSFSLYNMDFTPYMANVPLPGTFNIDYEIMYVTRKLFDCDSSNIEYVYSAPFSGTLPFQIIRTDGTIIFSLDSAAGPYCYGCLGGSDEIKPIRNTSDGAKLFLMKYEPTFTNIKTHIYSLCGSLPVGYYDYSNSLKSSVKLYPNPTSMELTIEVDLLDNTQLYDLKIYDLNGNVIINKSKINTKKYNIDVSNFSSGTYFYTLTNSSRIINSGKFVMTK